MSALVGKMDLQVFVDAKDILYKFDRLPSDLRDALVETTSRWMVDLKEYALEIRTWKDVTGRLAASHEVISTDDGAILTIDTRLRGAEKNYAMFIEYGTTKQAPRPWIIPAYNAKLPELEGKLRRAVAGYIDGYMNAPTDTFVRGGVEVSVRRIPKGMPGAGRFMKRLKR